MNGIRIQGTKAMSKAESALSRIPEDDLIEMNKRHACQAAADFLMDKDGVITVTKEKNIIRFEFDVFVMTPKELDDYVKAEIEKARGGQ